MEMEMKRTLAILTLVTSCAVAQAEGPAAGTELGRQDVPPSRLKTSSPIPARTSLTFQEPTPR